MRTTTSFLLGAAMIASTLIASAPQTTEATRIGVIRGDAVLSESNIGRQAREQLQSAIGDWEERIDTATEELTQMNEQLNEQRMTLSGQAVSDLEADIQEKEVEVSRMRDDAQREVQRLQQQVSEQINAQLVPLVDRFAEEQGLDVILDGSQTAGLLYFADSRDYTQEFVSFVEAQGGAGGEETQQQ